MRKRVEWLDALKGFGIVLVVFAHLCPAKEIEKYIYAFHMFLFFSISGYLYRKEKTGSLEYVLRRANALLLPFLFWNVCATAVSLVINDDTADVIRRFFTIGGDLCWDRPIWFLPVLFFAEQIFAVFDRHIPYGRWICLLGAPLIWYSLDGTQLILKLDIVPIAVFFYGFGACMAEAFASEFVQNRKRILSIIVLPVSVAVHVVFGVILNGRISYTGSSFGNYLYCFLAGIAGVVFWFVCFSSMKTGHVLPKLGQRSLFIMCSHYWYLTVASEVSIRLFDYDVWYARSTLKAILATAVLFVLIEATIMTYAWLSKRICWLKRLGSVLGIPSTQ